MSIIITRRRALGGVAALVAASSIPFVKARASDNVKIGLATWTEGPALRAGRAYTRAFKAAIKYVNDRGGILGGRDVEGVIASQGMTGESAKAAALRLAQRDQVKALVGPHWAVMAPAALSVAQRYSLPYAPEQGGMWLYKQNYPGTLGLSYTARARTLPQMRWMEKKGYKRVLVMLADITYNHDVEGLMREVWDKAGSPVKIVDTMYVPFGQTDLKKELTKALGQNPDFIWSEEWSSPVSISLMKTLRELGYEGGVGVTASLTTEVLAPVPKEISEGVYSHMDFAPDPNVPENKAFLEYWKQEWGPGETPYRAEQSIWSQTVFLLLAMDAAGTEGDGTPEGLMKIHDGMRNLKWVSPKGENVVLSKEGLGLWRRSPMVRITNGELKVAEYLPQIPNDWLPNLPMEWDKI
jgi:branched-chain amino acid transport system substrate-binding protein